MSLLGGVAVVVDEAHRLVLGLPARFRLSYWERLPVIPVVRTFQTIRDRGICSSALPG
jgi:hypothetical protein